MSLLYYIQNQLPTQITNYLNSYRTDKEGFPNLEQYYSSQDWFNQKTVTAVAFNFLLDWIVSFAEKGQYLLLANQPYPNYPINQEVDIMIVDRNGDLIFFDIKADFNLGNMEEDLKKLEQAYQNIKPLEYGFAMYCVEETQAKDSAKQLEQYQRDYIKALAIVKK